MSKRSDDVGVRGHSHPGFRVGSFRLGGHRKDRGQSPPVPPVAGGNGVQTPSGATETGTERDYSRMANPLASGAHRSRAAEEKPYRSYAQIQRSDERRFDPPRPTEHRAAAADPGYGYPPPPPPAYRRATSPPVAPGGFFGASADFDEAASHRYNEELLSSTDPAESFTDYRALRRAVNEATHPSYAPKYSAPTRQPSRDTTWSTMAAEADYEQDEEEGPRILVLDRAGDFANDLAEATVDLEPMPEVLRLGRSTQVIEVVEQEEPDILVLAPQEMTGAGLKRVTSVHRSHPEIVVVLSESDKDVSPSQIAATGTEELIPRDADFEQIRARIARAVDTKRRRQIEVEEAEEPDEPVYEEPMPVPSFMQAPRRTAASPTKLARVFTVASASGGCGKTFYSTNLAAYLARATGGKVLLVDLDLQFGEVAISLHLRPKRTIAELVSEEDIAAALGDYVIGHSGNFQVLCAPRDPIAGDKVGPRETTAVLEAARSAYDYIVVDTPPSLNETVLAAFDQSQSLVLMATMDLPSLKNLRVFLETLKKLSLPADQISVIVNKAESGTGIDLKEVEPLYPQGFSAVLPYAKQVSWSINMGMPVLMADPDADISRKFAEGATKLVKPAAGVVLPWATTASAPRRGWLSRLLKGTG